MLCNIALQSFLLWLLLHFLYGSSNSVNSLTDGIASQATFSIPVLTQSHPIDSGAMHHISSDLSNLNSASEYFGGLQGDSVAGRP
ncbi:hypothetical protein AAHA92_00130 [Salvia divinorum]|uniref:Uncharacterized protein n=1 Tax=Salvia divinorum TaxID=28513 RepID=A0ABD1III1_SALDI